MKIQREDHGLGKNFVYRHRGRDGYLADLPLLSDDYFAVEEVDIPNIEPMFAMVGAQSSTPTPRLEDSTAHCLRSRRHDGPAACQAVAEHIPGRVVIQLTAAVDATEEPEMAPDTANVGLSEGSSGHPLPRCPSVNCTVRDSKRPSTS
jgi:hypothetical protein